MTFEWLYTCSKPKAFTCIHNFIIMVNNLTKTFRDHFKFVIFVHWDKLQQVTLYPREPPEDLGHFKKQSVSLYM